MKKTYRVVHLPTSVGGNPQGLSRHLTKLGVQSETWIFSQNLFNYKSTRAIWNHNDGLITRELKRWIAVLSVAYNFDIIHFNYGSGWFTPTPLFCKSDRGVSTKLRRFFSGLYLQVASFIELNIYRMLRRPMFVHYQGDDARQGDYCRRNFAHSVASFVDPDYYMPEMDSVKRLMIKRMNKYCQKIYAVNPDLMHVLGNKAEFIPYSHISLSDWIPTNALEVGCPLRIGHAPSNRKVKGTDIILSSLNELRLEGVKFELILVENVSHLEAKIRYAQIDILIDQLHAGWYGGLAVELMALGKPVATYIRDEDLEFIPPNMRTDLPLLRINQDTLKEDLRKLLSLNAKQVHDLGLLGRQFVERWHDPLRIASQIKQDYEHALKIVSNQDE